MDRRRDFGFLLKDVSRRYVARFEARARDMALTLPQCKVLVWLDKNEGVSQARLAELTEIEPMTMVRILDRMEGEGLLERRPDPGDRRARRLYLTARSKPLLAQIWRLADRTRAEAFAGIARARRDAFIDTLRRIHHNVCALGDPGGERAPPAATTVRAPGARAKPRAARSSRASS